MSKIAGRATLERLIKKIDTAPRFRNSPPSMDDRKRLDDFANDLALREGGRFDDNWTGARIRLGGITSTCTSGTAGVLRNWQVAARKRLQAME